VGIGQGDGGWPVRRADHGTRRLPRVGFPEGFQIGLVVGATIACVALWSATVAAVLPLVLEQLGIDPAVVSAPLISTFVDATGLLIYMTIAGLLLLQL
jgi:Mg/Co/Ni transporter MgtE